MFSLLICCVTLILLFLSTNADTYLNPLSDEFIDLINSEQNTWIAGRNFPSDMPLENLKKLVGAIKESPQLDIKKKIHDLRTIDKLPEKFDSRDKWPNCPSLNEIRNQGLCGSCWAFGAVEAMTDRYCIHSNGIKQFHFSAQDLVSCCKTCGNGYDGGSPIAAWISWVDDGVVSGGIYGSKEGCMPYEIPPNHGYELSTDHITPPCVKTCIATYNKTYNEDKHHGLEPFTFYDDNLQIQYEIYENGPLEATFDVYHDFFLYKNGVYRHKTGAYAGAHAVKIIGWGVENSTKYWMVANSWGSKWGDLGGFFKIVRDENHCGIEEQLIGGMPLYR